MIDDKIVKSIMTNYDWEKINQAGNNLTDEQQEELIKNQTVIDALNNYKECLYIDGKDVYDDLIAVYILASDNILGETVLHYLRSLEDTDIMMELVNGVFLPLAVSQKKKTDFKKVIHKEVAKRDKRLKELEKEQKRLDYEDFLKDKPPYFGKPFSQEVVEQILNENGIMIRLNMLTKKLEFSGHGANKLFLKYSRENITETFPDIIKDICTENEVSDCHRSYIESYLFNIADANRYHPVQEMLKANQNDDASHLETIYVILRLTDDFDKMLVKKWLIQTVAFAFATLDNPVSAEGVLVLQGEQGKGKTSFFRVLGRLAGKPEWFQEGAVIDLRNKDSIITAITSWITELGELDSTLRKDQSALKAFITRDKDTIRMPYGKTYTDMPRSTSFCGTVNPEQFLKDTTGNRRYWTIHVDNIDRHKLFSLTANEVSQIWGYVYTLYLENPQGFRLNDVELQRLAKRNQAYTAEMIFEGEVRSLMDFDLPKERWTWTSPADLQILVSGARAENIGRVCTQLLKVIPGAEKKRTSAGYVYLLPLSQHTIDSLHIHPYTSQSVV